MSRKAIKDRNFRVLGYIETMPDGRQKALNANFRTLGYYNPRRDATTDANSPKRRDSGARFGTVTECLSLGLRVI
jgi:hypothetical protein